MALRPMELRRIQIEGWKFKSVYEATCPHCHESYILPLSWRRKNKYGTLPCPFCFGTASVPGRKRRSVFDENRRRVRRAD